MVRISYNFLFGLVGWGMGSGTESCNFSKKSCNFSMGKKGVVGERKRYRGKWKGV